MKIGILHLTDLHLQENNVWIEDKPSKIISSIKNTYEDCHRIYIVFSGDIAFSGKKEEYLIALKFLNSMRSLFNNFYKDKLFSKIIITPGNHDCDFTIEDQIRRMAVKNINYEYIGDDNSIIDSCINVQKNYFEFVKELNHEAEDISGIYSSFNDSVGDHNIVFHCYNTSWMSSIEEKPGSLFYPVEKVKTIISPLGDLNISVFHHNESWLQRDTYPNNMTEFKDWISMTSDIIFRGHEHVLEAEKTKNIINDNEILDFSGIALCTYEKEQLSSGYQTLVIDIENKKGDLNNYSLVGSIYSNGNNSPFEFNEIKKKNNKFKFKKEFLTKLNEIKLPLFENEKQIHLRDIYVFPDIEKSADSGDPEKIYSDYFDSSELVDTDKYPVVMLEGESQSGKSSLINVLYLSYIEKHVYPLLINGKVFKDSKNLESIIQKSFNSQYEKDEFERYCQEDERHKAVLIDNLDLTNLKGFKLFDLLEKLERRFSKIIITTSTLYNGVSFLGCDFDNVLYARILPLGYKKRNKLIEQFHLLNKEDYGMTDQLFLDKIKISYQQVQTFLGEKLMPSYPVFIMSILQAMNLNKNFNHDQTSYGYCYQTLIHAALSVKANIKNEDIDTYHNFLSELALNFSPPLDNFYSKIS